MLVLLLLIPLIFIDDVSWVLSQKKTAQKWVVSPSYSHNSTYGHIFGARIFIYPVGKIGYYTASSGNISQKDKNSSNQSFIYKRWYTNGNILNFIFTYNSFLEPYYELNKTTNTVSRIDIPVDKLFTELAYIHKTSKYLYGGYFIRFNHRKEKGGEAVIFPKETFLSGGVILRYDSRNDRFHSTQGEYYEVRSWFVSRFPSPIFLEGDMRLFFSLNDKLILALRGQLGLTLLTNSSYTSRFSLGGSHRLRGYRLNRFLGENYYLSQTELRFIPGKYLTLTSFVDLGTANNKSLFFKPHYAVGAGIRIGIPPDGNKRIRLEFSIGLPIQKDQYNMIVSFNHPF